MLLLIVICVYEEETFSDSFRVREIVYGENIKGRASHAAKPVRFLTLNDFSCAYSVCAHTQTHTRTHTHTHTHTHAVILSLPCPVFYVWMHQFFSHQKTTIRIYTFTTIQIFNDSASESLRPYLPVRHFHSCEREISGTPRWNFLKFGTNVQLNSGMNLVAKGQCDLKKVFYYFWPYCRNSYNNYDRISHKCLTG